MQLELGLVEALELIAGKKCENYTGDHGSCFVSGRTLHARYGADRACDACIAWVALETQRDLIEKGREPEQPREIGPVDKVPFTIDHLLAHLQIEADFVVDRVVVTRGQRLVLRDLLQRAHDEIARLNDECEALRIELPDILSEDLGYLLGWVALGASNDDGCEAARAIGAAIVQCEEMQAIKAVLLSLASLNTFGAPRIDVLRLLGLPDICVEWVLS